MFAQVTLDVSENESVPKFISFEPGGTVLVHSRCEPWTVPPNQQCSNVELELRPRLLGLPSIPEGSSERDLLRMTNIAPGEYSVRFRATPGYVASAHADNTDVLIAPLSVTNNTTSVDVVIRDDGVDVTGFVTGDPERRAAGSHVLAIPTDDGVALDLRSGVVDGADRFTIFGLYPGTYRMFAVASDDSFVPSDARAVQLLPNDIPIVTVTNQQVESLSIPLLTDTDFADVNN